MKIEKAKIKDAMDLTDLSIRSKSHWNYSEQQILEWTDELTISPKYIDEHNVYKLILNGLLIGFYAYHHEKDTALKLNSLFIEPEFIGQGYGKILMEDFLKRIENSGYKSVIVDSDPNAEKFYKRSGFLVIGQLQSSIKDRFLPVLEKEISK